jgi:hypothetical protein
MLKSGSGSGSGPFGLTNVGDSKVDVCSPGGDFEWPKSPRIGNVDFCYTRGFPRARVYPTPDEHVCCPKLARVVWHKRVCNRDRDRNRDGVSPSSSPPPPKRRQRIITQTTWQWAIGELTNGDWVWIEVGSRTVRMHAAFMPKTRTWLKVTFAVSEADLFFRGLTDPVRRALGHCSDATGVAWVRCAYAREMAARGLPPTLAVPANILIAWMLRYTVGAAHKLAHV